ncbi:hypothetical protein OROMI_002703 [Orobanche minor]
MIISSSLLSCLIQSTSQQGTQHHHITVSETNCSGNTYSLAAGMLPDWLFLVLSPINIGDASVVHSRGWRSEPYLDAALVNETGVFTHKALICTRTGLIKFGFVGSFDHIEEEVPGLNVQISLSASEILKLADHIIAKSKKVHDAIASVPLDKCRTKKIIFIKYEWKVLLAAFLLCLIEVRFSASFGFYLIEVRG